MKRELIKSLFDLASHQANMTVLQLLRDEADPAYISLLECNAASTFAKTFRAIQLASTLPDNDGAILQARQLTEGRKKGQPLGAQANRRKAVASREALVRLAKPILERKPDLKSNLSKLASEIRSLDVEELKQAG
jgi:hypothetical protein